MKSVELDVLVVFPDMSPHCDFGGVFPSAALYRADDVLGKVFGNGVGPSDSLRVLLLDFS